MMGDPNLEPRIEWDQEVIKRKIQISFLGTDDDKSVFTYYWNKLMKPSDEIVLTHVFKNSVKEDEVRETQEKVMNTPGVGSFIDECVKRKMQFQTLFSKGKSGEGICELAHQCQPHLVIIGSRGLNKIQRTLQTSVSEYVLHNSRAPVLIVPFKSV